MRFIAVGGYFGYSCSGFFVVFLVEFCNFMLKVLPVVQPELLVWLR